MFSWLLTLFIVSTAQGLPQFAVQGDAEYYRIVVVQEQTVVLDAWFTPSVCDAVCQLQPMDERVPRLMNGRYMAYVQGFDRERGYSPWAGGTAFLVSEPPPSVESLVLVQVDCPLQPDGLRRCNTAQPQLTFAFDQHGLDSGNWVEVVVQMVGGPVVHQTWLAIREDNRCALDRCTLTVPLLATAEELAYMWYIRSWGAGGPSTGGLQGYTVPGGVGDPDYLAQFRVQLPNHPPVDLETVIQDGEVILHWRHEPSAQAYELVMTNDVGQIVWQEWVLPVCQAWCEHTLALPLTVGRYQWAVRYWNGLVSPWQHTDFVLDMEPPLPPVLVGRIDSLYQWLPMVNATWYRIVIVADDGVTGIPVFDGAYQAKGQCQSVCFAQPNLNLSPGYYRWTVQAWGPGGLSAESEPLRFTINAPIAPQLIAPLTFVEITQLDMPLQFEWQPVIDAQGYELQLVADGSIVYAAMIHNSTTYILNDIPPNEMYSWRVRAWGGPWTVSETAVIRINVPASAVPQLQSPGPEAVLHTSVVFAWKSADNATRYVIRVVDEAMQVIWQDAVDCCTALPVLKSGRYGWQVGSWGPGNGEVITWSEMRWFQML